MLRGWGHQLPTQLKFEFPVVAAKVTGTPYEIGPGNSAVGLKFNFYNDESRGLRLSVYPQLEFSAGSSAEKGVADAGQTFVLPVLVSHESKYVTLVGNAGLSQAIHVQLGGGTGEAARPRQYQKRADVAEVVDHGNILAKLITEITTIQLSNSAAGFTLVRAQ